MTDHIDLLPLTFTDKKLIVEESPEMYKEVDDVVEDLVEQGIVEIVACLKPVVTYKLRAQVR